MGPLPGFLKTMFILPKQNAFTLLEIITVITIIGIVAAFALPKFTMTIEQFRAEDGKQILKNIFAAQKRYHVENKEYALDQSDLDLEFRSSPDFVMDNVAAPASGPTSLGTVSRIQGGATLYTLSISTAGQMTCTPGISPDICGKIGF